MDSVTVTDTDTVADTGREIGLAPASCLLTLVFKNVIVPVNPQTDKISAATNQRDFIVSVLFVLRLEIRTMLLVDIEGRVRGVSCYTCRLCLLQYYIYHI